MLLAQHAVRSSVLRSHSWAGLSCVIVEALWSDSPGWLTWSFERPALCFLLEEVGGRATLRSQPDASPDGEFFGAGHLSLIATTDQVTLHSSSMRQALFAYLTLNPQDANYLTTGQAELIARVSTRLMFQDTRLHACVQLLGAYECDDPTDAYGVGLSQAVLATLVGVVSSARAPIHDCLTGRLLEGVMDYIDAHLDERLTNETLAKLARVAPARFGSAFRDATGLSPQRWQMDARVRLAQRLMFDDPKLSLAAIAGRSGFADQSHFSRAFFDIVGISPTAWLHQRR